MTLKRRLLYPFARKFFAGVTLKDAAERAWEANSLGMGVTLDFLGEDVMDSREAESAMLEYARVIEAISAGGLDASLAVKLTHIGLDIGREVAENNMLGLMETARGKGVFVWIDMEGSEHTEDTIRIYRTLLGRQGGEAGIALQAYLRRTWTDLKSLVPDGAKVRLVKGAYNEPHEIAYQKMSEIRAAFTGMMEYLYANSKAFAIGTHDRGLIQKGLALSRAYGGSVEFQMLMGMRDDLKRALTAQGQRVVEYVPYGSDWYGYGIRRLKEKRRNILYFAQGLVGR